MAKYLLGPELLWLLAYLAAYFIALPGRTPSRALENFIDKGSFYVPLLVPLCFALFWMPMVEKSWLVVRIWIACILGGILVLEKIFGSYNRNDTQSGLNNRVGMLIIFGLLVLGSIGWAIAYLL